MKLFSIHISHRPSHISVSAVAFVSTVVLLSWAAIRPASAQSLTMTAIGPLTGGTQSVAYGISSTGAVVGSSTITGGATHAFLWTPSAPNSTSGSIKDLGLLPGGTFSIAYGVNSAGQVVGEADTTNMADPTSLATHAFLYSGGSMTDLGTLGGRNSAAYAINDSSQIVGEAQNSGQDTHAFTCDTTLVLKDMGVSAGGSYSAAFALNSSNQIVGEADTAAGNTHGFLGSSTIGPLQDLGVLTAGTYSSASSINNEGLIVGSADTNGETDAFLWTMSSPIRATGKMYNVGAYTTSSSGSYHTSTATGINNLGQTVGTFYGSGNLGNYDYFNPGYPSYNGYEGAFFYSFASEQIFNPGSPTNIFRSQGSSTVGDINVSLFRNSTTWFALQTNAINDTGQAVGMGDYSSNRTAFLMQTIPGDGANPIGRPAYGTDGSLYGTTAAGGASGVGTIYKLLPASPYTFTVLHHFNLVDGVPYSGLVQVGGNFYGTTHGTSQNPQGVVFKITPAGVYTVINDQYGNYSGLIYASDSNFYGTTDHDGTYSHGAVFKMDINGNVTVLHAFANAAEGTSPNALVEGTDGALYGTTASTIYKVTKTGTYTLLHTLTGSEGSNCMAGLIQSGGNFYGTAESGGSLGYGTIFMMTPAGALTVVFTFNGMISDQGGNPYAALSIDQFGSLYAPTWENGGGVLKTTLSGSPYTLYPFETNSYYDGGGFSNKAFLFPYDSLLPSTLTGSHILYGVAAEGGYTLNSPPNFLADGNGLGVVFSYSSSGGGFPTAIHDFRG